MMKSTGKWVVVAEDPESRRTTVRLLHKDRRGRDCVRYERQWVLVERKRGDSGYRYVIGGKA